MLLKTVLRVPLDVLPALALVAATLAGSAQAQSSFCVGGNLDHLSAAQRAACSGKIAEIRLAAQRFHAPQDWHFVLVCGEEGWKEYVAFSSHPATQVQGASTDTNLSERTTYVRESLLSQSATTETWPSIIGQEIASLRLRTPDDAVSDKPETPAR